MNATINVEVKNLGHKVGTVGWLTSQIDKVTLGQTKNGDPAAWLELKDGSSHCLAIFDPYGVGDQMPNQRKVMPVERHSGGYAPECRLILTDAAWAVFSSLAEQAADMLNAMLSESEEMAPEVALVKVGV